MKKTEDTQISLLLDVILQETRKHRELLKHLSAVFEHGAVVSSSECERQMGKLFTQAVALVHSVKDEILQGKPIEEAARQLIAFEEGASEEYLTEIHVRVAMLAQTNQAVKKILEGIAEDERGHVEILRLITEIASKNQL